MRFEKYGADDWELIYCVYTQEAGRVETSAHRVLRKWATTRTYWKDGFEQVGIELFECGISRAIAAIEAVLGEAKLSEPVKFREWVKYEFNETEIENA
jgi:hypothetical protein